MLKQHPKNTSNAYSKIAEWGQKVTASKENFNMTSIKLNRVGGLINTLTVPRVVVKSLRCDIFGIHIASITRPYKCASEQ
jgi:hypothetical protein